MNLINAKYGNEPGLKAYTHVSDPFGPFATQTIPATVSKAPYILDGLLMNDTGRNIKEQYADTGGFTDHVFAVTALLGFQFIPRIRDLPSKRLYVFDPASIPKELKGLIGGKIREGIITANWPDILRSAATMVAGVMPPSQLLRKFAAYPRQHALAEALKEIGRVERTLFIIEWVLDADMQRRAQIGLNKGEAHHALKNALRIGRKGEIRDRTTEGQHFRMAGLNLLAAIIIYWNTKHPAKRSTTEKAKDWTARPIFRRTPRLSDGHISSSPANTGGQNHDQTALAYDPALPGIRPLYRKHPTRRGRRGLLCKPEHTRYGRVTRTNWSPANPERFKERIPPRHPLRKICQVVNDALASIDAEFECLYADFGRPSIALERLIRASLIQILFSIRSERQWSCRGLVPLL